MSGQTSQSEGKGSYDLLKETTGDKVIKTEQVQIERKVITCTLKQNRRGHFLRISEVAGSHRHTLILPATAVGIRELQRVLAAVLAIVDE